MQVCKHYASMHAVLSCLMCVGTGKRVEFDVCKKRLEFDVCRERVEFDVCKKRVEFAVCGKRVEFDVCGKRLEFDVCKKRLEFAVCGKRGEATVVCAACEMGARAGSAVAGESPRSTDPFSGSL